MAEAFEGWIVDPCAGMGRIMTAAHNAGYPAHGYDINPRQSWIRKQDFMDVGDSYDNIVSNPPFTLCEATKERPNSLVSFALMRARKKLALLMPTLWMQADKRSRWLETTPLYKVLMLTPRPSMPPGAVIEAGEKPQGGRQDFAWFIWKQGHVGPVTIGWLRREP